MFIGSRILFHRYILEFTPEQSFPGKLYGGLDECYTLDAGADVAWNVIFCLPSGNINIAGNILFYLRIPPNGDSSNILTLRNHLNTKSHAAEFYERSGVRKFPARSLLEPSPFHIDAPSIMQRVYHNVLNVVY